MSRVRVSSLLLPIVYLGFISLGLPDGTLGVAWPEIHRTLSLPIGLAGVLMLATTLLSAVSSFSSGRLIARFRTGPVVLVSCLATGGALLVVAHAHGLGGLLLAVAPLGLGAGAVDAGLNGFVARHYSGRHMNWLHACWGIGAACGPIVMARAIHGGAGWRGGYTTLATAQLALAAVFACTLTWWQSVPTRTPRSEDVELARPPTRVANTTEGWLSAAIFAVYVAVEATTGLWAGSILVEARGVAPATAGLCISGYYAAITTGRLLVGFAVDRWGNRFLVALGGAIALAAAVLFALAPPLPIAAAGLVLMGLGFAPIYPCLMHEVPRRFAPEAVQTVIGRQAGAAYLGAASLPALAGLIAPYRLEAIVWVVTGTLAGLIGLIRVLDHLTPPPAQEAATA